MFILSFLPRTPPFATDNAFLRIPSLVVIESAATSSVYRPSTYDV